MGVTWYTFKQKAPKFRVDWYKGAYFCKIVNFFGHYNRLDTSEARHGGKAEVNQGRARVTGPCNGYPWQQFLATGKHERDFVDKRGGKKIVVVVNYFHEFKLNVN